MRCTQVPVLLLNTLYSSNWRKWPFMNCKQKKSSQAPFCSTCSFMSKNSKCPWGEHRSDTADDLHSWQYGTIWSKRFLANYMLRPTTCACIGVHTLNPMGLGQYYFVLLEEVLRVSHPLGTPKLPSGSLFILYPASINSQKCLIRVNPFRW